MKKIFLKRTIVAILALSIVLAGFPSVSFAAPKIPVLHEITSHDTDVQNPGGVQNELVWSHQVTGNFQFYRVYRRNDDELSSFELLATEIDVKSYTDEDVEPGTAYEYYVSAYFENPGSNPDWEEVVSNIQSVITSTDQTEEVDDVLLASVVTSDQEPLDQGGVQNELTWTHERGLSFDHYEVYRKNLEDIESFILLSDSIDVESYTDESAVPGVSYEYYILAVYSGDVTVESNHEICDTQLDDMLVISLLSVDISDIDPLFINGVQNHLIWEHSEEEPQFQYYEVYRDDLADDPDLGFEELSGNINEKIYTDDTAVSGVEYEYYTTAVYNDGNGDIKIDSNHLTVTTALDRVASVLLHDIVSSDIDSGELSGVENYLSWDHEEESEFQYYELWRDNLEDDPHIGFVQLNGNLSDKFYTDAEVEPEVEYEYYVLGVYPENIEIESNKQIITTVADVDGPTVEFNPVHGDIGVAIDENITITFNKDVRNIDNSALANSDLPDMLTLRKTNEVGEDVGFSATITGKTIITITPDAVFDYSQDYYVEIAALVEDKDNNAIAASNATFTTEAAPDTTAPTITIVPPNEATDVSIGTMITIEFNEPIKEGYNLTSEGEDTLLSLQEGDSEGSHVPFTASINTERTMITIDPNSNLSYSSNYYVAIGAVEDEHENENPGVSATFTTETQPSSGNGSSSGSSSSSSRSGTTIDAGPSEIFIFEDELTPLGAVEFLNPYITGYPDGTYRPKKSVTRAEFSVVLARILELDLSNPGPQMFSDVNRDDWHYNYIQALAKTGILKGNDDGTFKPDRAVTHAEAAAIIAEYWEYLEIEVSGKDSGLKDIKGNWAEKEINKLFNEGITEGFGDNSFFPNHTTTREQMVQMINRLIARPMIEVEVSTFIDVDRNYEAFDDIESASHRALNIIK